jgi:hypothetical protein
MSDGAGFGERLWRHGWTVTEDVAFVKPEGRGIA